MLPAFSPRERQVALPLMLMVPFLFIAGVVFAYFIVLPAAVNFLQNFNDDNYDILLQARDYYKFAIMVLIAMGLAVPDADRHPRGHARWGSSRRAQLRQQPPLRDPRHRRSSPMLLPGQDPVTMLLMMVPIVLLYEGSILSRLAARPARSARARAAEDDEPRSDLDHLDDD